MSILTREAILASRRRRILTIRVDAWGGDVRTLPLSVGQLLEATKPGSDTVRVYTRLVSELVCDDEGAPILTLEDVETMDVDTILDVAKAVIAASKAGQGDDEGAAKNS